MSIHEMQGLTTNQAQENLITFGKNKLPEKKPPTHLEIFLGQLKSPLVYILIVAAIITYLLGDYEDSVIIGVAIVLNTILGYYQESKAGQELQALKKMLQSTTRVIRNGKKETIITDYVVPGDIVLLKAGEKAPADGKVIDANRLFMMEAMLTGESVAVQKDIEDKNTIFMGTIVQGGQGALLVEKTGANTEMGKIASNLQHEEHTPLQKQLDLFSKQLTWVVLGLSSLVFVIGVGKLMYDGALIGFFDAIKAGHFPIELVDIFTTSVALAVGAIPEGLLIALTAVLAIGMQRILKKKGLVKNLTSAETLGGVTVICSDKTGTLTQGKMSVITIQGDSDDLRLQAGIANDEDNAVGIATAEWARSISDTKQLKKSFPKIDSIPFSSENKFFASLNEYKDDEHMLFVNGAPDYLLEWTSLTSDEKKKIKDEIFQLTNMGYRLVAYARKIMPKSYSKIKEEDCKNNLEWVGFLGMSDPIREDVKAALQKTKQAGIKLIVITGDFANTAKHIMHQLGADVQDNHIMLGTDLAMMSDDDLGNRLEGDGLVKLFARTKPEQKMRIIEELKKDGEIVAMMGDGVNDAPALKRADIGIVVNEATDVAKESADLILLDSSFNTIVDAVEEGRGMFDNIRKIILYLMCDAFVQIIAIIIAMLTGYPIPVTAGQILWINLVSDGFPSLALTVDPKRKGLMKVPPRDPKTQLISKWIMSLISIVSVAGAIITFLLFTHVLRESGGDLELARSVAFASFGITTMLYIYSVRSLKAPLRSEHPFNNLWLLAGIAGGFALIITPFTIPSLGNFLDIVPIGNRWYHAFGSGIVVVGIIEVFKAYLRQKSNR